MGEDTEDTWASLADQFADEAYATVKGYVRTYVMHQQLLEHLPPPPAAVLDVGGGAGHQSLPLAQAGYQVTLLDPSRAMLDKAGQRLERLPGDARARVTLLQADGENAASAVDGRRFDAVLCHGVLGYLERPEPMVGQLCRCAAPGGLVSIMTGNADTMAVRPAMERRWEDALASFDATTEIGVLGVQGRADTVEGLERGHAARERRSRARWYGGVAVRRLASSSAAPPLRPGRLPRRSGRRQRSELEKPAGETPTASSAASFTSWGARAQANVKAMDAEITRAETTGRARLLPRVRSYDVDLDFTRGPLTFGPSPRSASTAASPARRPTRT